MEKKRSNKKLFAIIGGSVLAFILTIALSVSITLAYFGDTASGTSTITLNDPVWLGDGDVIATAQTNITAIPTQYVDITATAGITASDTNSVLFAYVNTDNTAINLVGAEFKSDDSSWEVVGEVTLSSKTYVLYAIATEALALTPLGTSETTKTLTYSFQVDPAIQNWGTEETPGTAPTFGVAINFVRVQQIYTSDAKTTLSVDPADYVAALTQVIGNSATVEIPASA